MTHSLFLKVSVGVYRAFLLLYPASFTREFCAQMVQVFQDMLEDAKSKGGLLSVLRAWTGVLWDLLVSVVEQHRLHGLGRFERWTAAGFILCLPAVAFWVCVFLDTFLGSELGRLLVEAQSNISPIGQASLWLGLPAIGLTTALHAARVDGRSALSLGGIGVNGLLVIAVLGAATLRVS
jgi:hypothetical protein